MSQQSVLNVHLNEGTSGVEESVSTRSHKCLGLDGGVGSSGDFYLPACSMSEIQRCCEKLLSCQDIRVRVLHSGGLLENTLDSSPRKACPSDRCASRFFLFVGRTRLPVGLGQLSLKAFQLLSRAESVPQRFDQTSIPSVLVIQKRSCFTNMRNTASRSEAKTMGRTRSNVGKCFRMNKAVHVGA
jgi:hypothetical protein